ncbi:hypothetical protein [Ruegeria atlantica]|uniref:hypothetical protein n=1 Tax=Ruegeria atlantica TaxID=81569 RepID=UPI001480788B|nr:hypothetical protein [Ruegeria atlantica]
MKRTVTAITLMVALAACETSTSGGSVSKAETPTDLASSFINACLKTQPSFDGAKDIFASQGIKVINVRNATSFPTGTFATVEEVFPPAKGKVCNLSFKGNDVVGASQSVQSYLESNSFPLKGAIQTNVPLDDQGTTASLRGIYRTSDGRELEVAVFTGKLPRYGKITTMGVIRKD